RRRHTRSDRDWSSDVCSSDLRSIGSYLVAQNFSSPFFFHSRNVTLSASGVDPDITLADALSQIPRISGATNITQGDLSSLVSQRSEERRVGKECRCVRSP